MTTSLAKNYAEALFSIVLENNNMDQIQIEMKLLKEIVNENNELLSFLMSSFISIEDKETFIDETLKDFNEDIRILIKILTKNHRGKYLPEVIDAFNSMCNEKKGILEGLIYSVFELNKEQMKKIEEKISSIEKVPCELKNIIDQNLIGGIKVVINGHIYDGSIQNKIESMRISLNK